MLFRSGLATVLPGERLGGPGHGRQHDQPNTGPAPAHYPKCPAAFKVIHSVSQLPVHRHHNRPSPRASPVQFIGRPGPDSPSSNPIQTQFTCQLSLISNFLNRFLSFHSCQAFYLFHIFHKSNSHIHLSFPEIQIFIPNSCQTFIFFALPPSPPLPKFCCLPRLLALNWGHQPVAILKR